MIPNYSKVGQGTRIHFWKVLNEDGMRLHLNREVMSKEIHSVNDAEQCLEKENQQSGNEYGRAVRS